MPKSAATMPSTACGPRVRSPSPMRVTSSPQVCGNATWNVLSTQGSKRLCSAASCEGSCSLAAAASSEFAALAWVTWFICATALLTCSMPVACSLDAAETSAISCDTRPTVSVIFASVEATSRDTLTPFSALRCRRVEE